MIYVFVTESSAFVSLIKAFATKLTVVITAERAPIVSSFLVPFAVTSVVMSIIIAVEAWLSATPIITELTSRESVSL